MIKCTTFFVILLFSAILKAEVTYLQLQQITDAKMSLKGEFSQQKYLAELEVNLASFGNFEYQKGEKIIWRTLKPIANEMVMTPSNIVNSQNNQEIVRIESTNNPAVALMSEIFFSVLTAQWQKLSRYFQLEGEINGKYWQVELLPLDDNIKKAVSLIELKGSNLLHSIVLHEKDGDKTTILFEYNQ